MKTDQVALWQHLKDQEPSLFNDVCQRLPKPLVQAYDAQAKVVTSPAIVTSIDEKIKKNNLDTPPSLNADRQQISPALLNEPPMVLAYLYLVCPTPLVTTLDQQLSIDKREAVLLAMDQLQPHRLSTEIINRFLAYVDLRCPSTTVTDVPRQKERVMEKLASLDAPDRPDWFNPKQDLLLFSLNHQRVIFAEFHRAGVMVPYLAYLDVEQQSNWLLALSERQRALMIDALKSIDSEPEKELELRNQLIDIVRQLQDDGRIDAGVKRA